MNKYDFEGRSAIVTGGGQGIGLAVVNRILASGGNVSIWDRDQALLRQTVSELGMADRVQGVPTDIADLAAVQDATAATRQKFGTIDVLINNAAIVGPNANTWEYPPEAFAEVVRIGLIGTFHCCHAVVPHMIAAKYGRIVNVSSVAGKEGNPKAPAYSSTKAAVIALTKSLGKELAGYDIAVNAVTPAAAKTAIFDQLTQEHIDFMLSKIPRNRFVTVDEVAALVAWIASQDNSFTTGAVFDLSGGRATY